MAILKWSAAYSIGVAVLDAEHKHFFELLNQLYDGIIDGTVTDAKTRDIADRVLAFAIDHCRHEEEMLAAAGYPDLPAIHAQHQKLRETIEGYRRILLEQGGVSVALSNFLMEWVIQHILKEDKKCGRFLNAAGIR